MPHLASAPYTQLPQDQENLTAQKLDDGDAWNYFSHDQGRSRAYRWGEDGLVVKMIQLFGLLDPVTLLEGGKRAAFEHHEKS